MEYFLHCPFFSLRVPFWSKVAALAELVIFIFCPWALKPGDLSDYAEELCRKEAFLVLKEEKWGRHMCIYFSPTECLSCLFYIHVWCVVCALVLLYIPYVKQFCTCMYIICKYGIACLSSCCSGDVSVSPIHIEYILFQQSRQCANDK